MTESQLEPECLAWLADVGWLTAHGPDMAPDGATPERDSYRQVLLLARLRRAVATLNPEVPAAAGDGAVRQVMVKRILRKYKYPPDQQDAAVDLVLQQAHALGEAWA